MAFSPLFHSVVTRSSIFTCFSHLPRQRPGKRASPVACSSSRRLNRTLAGNALPNNLLFNFQIISPSRHTCVPIVLIVTPPRYGTPPLMMTAGCVERHTTPTCSFSGQQGLIHEIPMEERRQPHGRIVHAGCRHAYYGWPCQCKQRGQEEGTVDGRTVRASMGGDRRSLSSNSNRNNGPRMSDVGCRVCGDS